MNELIYFIAGAGLALIGFEVYLVLTLIRRISNLEQQSNIFEKDFFNMQLELERNHLDANQNLYDFDRNLQLDLNNYKTELGECYKYTDSRLDKLEHKLTEMYKNGCEPVQNAK